MGTASEVLTLAWDDGRGRITVSDSTPVRHALAGADLVDALAIGAVRLEGDRVVVAGHAPATGEAEVDRAVRSVVELVEARRRPPRARDVVSKLGTSRRFRRAVDELVRAGTLRIEPRRWWVFDLPAAHRLERPDEVAARREHLGHVLRGGATADGVDERTRAAVALLAPTALIGRFVDRRERREARRRAHELVDDPAVGEAVKEAVEAAEAAVIAVVAAGAAAASSG